MSAMRMLGLILLVGLIAAGCSDKKKEAARLEQEMREMEQRSADSAALVQDTIEDSLAAAPGDVDAVPEVSGSGHLSSVPCTPLPPPRDYAG